MKGLTYLNRSVPCVPANWLDLCALAHQSGPLQPSSRLFDSNLGCCSTLFPYLSKAVASVTLQDKLSHPFQVAEQRAWGPEIPTWEHAMRCTAVTSRVLPANLLTSDVQPSMIENLLGQLWWRKQTNNPRLIISHANSSSMQTTQLTHCLPRRSD